MSFMQFTLMRKKETWFGPLLPAVWAWYTTYSAIIFYKHIQFLSLSKILQLQNQTKKWKRCLAAKSELKTG